MRCGEPMSPFPYMAPNDTKEVLRQRSGFVDDRDRPCRTCACGIAMLQVGHARFRGNVPAPGVGCQPGGHAPRRGGALLEVGVWRKCWIVRPDPSRLGLVGLDGQEQGPPEVFRGPGYIPHERLVTMELADVDVPEPRFVDHVEVIRHGMAKRAEPILRAVRFEVRLYAGGRHLWVEHGEHETPAARQAGEELTEQYPEIRQVLAHQSAEGGVEHTSSQGELAVEIRLGERNRRIFSSRDAQHAAGEVEADRRAA